MSVLLLVIMPNFSSQYQCFLLCIVAVSHVSLLDDRNTCSRHHARAEMPMQKPWDGPCLLVNTIVALSVSQLVSGNGDQCVWGGRHGAREPLLSSIVVEKATPDVVLDLGMVTAAYEAKLRHPFLL